MRFAYWRHRALHSVVLALIAAGPAILSAAWHPRRPAWTRAAAVGVAEVTWAQTARWGGTALLIDARSPAAFSRGHIPGALSLDEAHWEEQLPSVVGAWRPGKRVVVYCDGAGCGAGAAVARRLRRDLGTDTVFLLAGGWEQWHAKNK